MEARFTAPTGLDLTTFPVYSGFIEVNSGSESVHAVYLGMVGDLKTKQVLDNTTSFFGYQIPAIIASNDQPQTQPTNYTFNGTDHPSLLFRFGLSLDPFMSTRLAIFFLHGQDELWIATSNY